MRSLNNLYYRHTSVCHLATSVSINPPSTKRKFQLAVIRDRDAKMAVCVWGCNVVYSHWRNCRFYFPVISMSYRLVHNAPTPCKVTSNSELRMGRMERYFINEECCLSTKTSCVDKHIYTFRMGRDCGVSKTTQTRNVGVSRCYSDDRGSPREKLPILMDFPEIVWPSVIKAFRNWILTNILIKPYFDKDFGLQDFVLGSKQVYLYSCILHCRVF
jgi:hypothetical protein